MGYDIRLLIDDRAHGPVRVTDDVTEAEFWDQVFFTNTDFSFVQGLKDLHLKTLSIHPMSEGRRIEADALLVFRLGSTCDDTFSRAEYHYRPKNSVEKALANQYTRASWAGYDRVIPEDSVVSLGLTSPCVICIPYYASSPGACNRWTPEKARIWVKTLIKATLMHLEESRLKEAI